MPALPYARKSLGQHWLTDEASLEAMCEAADVSAADTILEVGPGVGTLTALLVRKAAKVIAVEFDEQLARELPDRIPAANLTVVRQDILRFDLTALPTGYKVVANIPYYLTSNLIRILSEATNQATEVVLLVQKEVAERVAAKPGAMSLLSVSAQFYWETSLGRIMPAELFTPPPKVDSQILILKRRAKPLFSDIDSPAFFRVVKAGFSSRRKTLLNSLSGGLQFDKEKTMQLLQAAGINPSMRAQNLSLEDWRTLTRHFYK